MNLIRSIRSLLYPGVLAGLIAGLAAGCLSSPTPNQKVYDRYAELLAQRNRQLSSPAAAPASATPSRPADVKAPAAPAPVPPVADRDSRQDVPKTAVPGTQPAAAKPVAAPPVQVIAPVTKPAPRPEAVPSVPATGVPAVPGSVEPGSAGSVEAPVEPATSDGVYQLKVGDVVQVFLRGIPSPEVVDGNIDEHGMISLPLINEVVAVGQSASELARSIRQTYLDRGLYKNISVTVAVPTRFYFIQGEIRAPGRYQLVTATRLSQAIAGAAGYTEYASGQVLIRRGGKVFKSIRNARRLERTPQDDILLEPDDIIEVKRSLW